MKYSCTTTWSRTGEDSKASTRSLSCRRAGGHEENMPLYVLDHLGLNSTCRRVFVGFSPRRRLLIIYSDSMVKIPITVASGDAQGIRRGRGGSGGGGWGSLSGNLLSHPPPMCTHASSNMLRQFPRVSMYDKVWRMRNDGESIKTVG